MNTINDLRATLFDTLRGVKEGTLDLDRARAVSDLSQTIINTAKVEIDYARVAGQDVASGFLQVSARLPRRSSTGGEIVETETGRVHRLK